MIRLALAIILSLFALPCFSQAILQNAKIQNAKIGQTQPSGGGGGGPAKIFDATKGGTTGGCTTASKDATGSSVFIAATGGYRSPYPAQSSSPANTWTAGNAVAPGGGVAIKSWYVLSPTTSSSQTFSADGGDVGTQYSTEATLGFSGITALDSQGTATNTTGTSIHGSGTPLTPSSSTDVMFTAIRWDTGTGTTWVINSGYTTLPAIICDGGMGMQVAYKIKTDSTTEDPVWTGTGGSPSVAAIHWCFKP